MTHRAFIAIASSICVLVSLFFSIHATIFIIAYFVFYPGAYIVLLCSKDTSFESITIGISINIASIAIITTVMAYYDLWQPYGFAVAIICTTLILGYTDIIMTLRRRWTIA